MRIRIWGARGSTPTPIGPEDVKEKIISALLKISEIEDGIFREELISAILEGEPYSHSDSQSTPVDIGASRERRRIIETYLNSLSPLAGKTASGNTPCIEIQSGRDLFIIDAGSGIRALGNELMKGDFGQGEGELHLFFSHPHWDHIQGFPFFRPAYVPGNKIYIYGVHDIETALRRQQEFISFPVPLERMQANIEFIRLEPTRRMEFDELQIRMIRNHHPGDAYAFRFEKGEKSFIYASDASYPTGLEVDQYTEYIDFFNEADVLVFDSQFTQRESDEKEDWGHSSSFVGVEMAQRANVKQLVLYHYDPSYTDTDLEKILEDTLKFQKNQYPHNKPVEVTIAEEGMTFDLMPLPKTQLKQIPGGKVAILKPAGIFDETIAADLTEQLAAFQHNSWPPQLIVDLSSVEMLQVAGLKSLVKLRKEQQGTPMVLAGPSINVQQLIELAGYSDFFAIYPSVHGALNALKAHETLNLPGQTIRNRYHVEAKVGDGRLGTVFKATDTRYNRTVALKVLSASFSEGAIEQFLNQARQIINLVHPNIVDIYDCDEDRGLSFMVEEFIEGKTLRDLINAYQGRPLPLADALSIAERIAYGLEYAHTHDVIHGDLKPKNVLIFGDEVKISDFGLGRLESGKSLLNIDVPLAMVSAGYVAPEQILGHPLDGRTDLYALGAILYELFTGQPVFSGSDDDEVMRHHRDTTPRPPREINPNLSPALEHLILKLLDKDPNKRYVKARQVRRILGSMLTFAHGKLPRQRWPAFVADEESLPQLTELWRKTEVGQGQLVFITGQQGVGKTRLAHELTQNIGEATLLIGKCRHSNNGLAYHPFIDALNTYFSNTPSEEAQEQVGAVLREISRFVPEIRQHLPGNLIAALQASTKTRKKSGEYEINAQSLRAYPSISLANIIKEATKEKPWLIILDDLHRADPNSLHLLQYLGAACQKMPLMIVGIYQNEVLIDNEPLQDVIETLTTLTTYTTLTLKNLSQEGVKRLLENLWLQSVPVDLVTTIYRRTKGNPFYAEEVAKGLVDDGVVSWRDNKWHFAPVVEVGLPKDAAEAIMRRMGRLSKQTQTLLHQAAILGQTFRFDTLHEMSDLSRWDALESLDLALERQLIKEIPGEGVLRFKHIKIQQILYNNLSQLKRQLMHREAGDALERQYAATIDRAAEALAYHFYEAGEFEKSITHSRQAAANAEAIHASQVAIAWYTQALDALDQLVEDEAVEAERFELLLAREHLYNRRGERQSQIVDLQTLQKTAQTSGDPVKQATVHNRRAIYERVTSQLTEAQTEAQASLIAARQVGQMALEAKSLRQLAAIEITRGNLETALKHIQTIQTMLEKMDDPTQEAAIQNLLGSIHIGLNGYEAADGYYQEALNLQNSVGDRVGQAATLANLSTLYLIFGEYTEAESLCCQALEINRATGHRRGEAQCLHNLALIYKALGYYQAAEQVLELALPLRYTAEDHQGEAEGAREKGALARLTEDYPTAQRKLEQALDIFQRLELRAQEAVTWLELGVLFKEMNNLEQARASYEQARAIQQTLKNIPGEIEARGGIAHCLLAEDEIEAAHAEISDGIVWLEAHDIWGIRDPVRLYMTIYRVLRANKQMPAAKKALETAQQLTQQRANSIDDLGIKASSLETPAEPTTTSVSELS